MSRPAPIAVVGRACRFAGASDVDALWQLVREGRSALGPGGARRWSVDEPWLRADASPPPPSRVLHDVTALLPRGLDGTGSANGEDPVADADPSVRLAVEVARQAWRETVRASGPRADPRGLDRARVSVLLADIALPTDSSAAAARRGTGGDPEREGRSPPGSPSQPPSPFSRWIPGLAAAAVARDLGLLGGALTLDAACASSLYALHLACEELRAGRADAVLCGGVCRPDALYTQLGFTQLRALSPSGRCRPFDRRADGLLVGEGAGIFVLQRLDDALRQGRRVYGLLVASALANDLGGGLLAPDSEGQLRAMRAAYERAGWPASEAALIECHGTGTPRGDAVELESLRALRGAAASGGPCVLGAVKANVGHTLTAAGAAGLLKVLEALRHRTLPPQPDWVPAEAAAGLGDGGGGALRVLASAEPWPEPGGGGPRRAAVSAFGFGGVDAHLLVEEWPEGADGSSAAAGPRGRRPPGPPQSETEPVAIVGLGIRLSSLDSEAAVLRALRGAGSAPGRIVEVSILKGEFRIPPQELPALLPQQLLALRVAADAAAAAGRADQARAADPRGGVVAGIGLDPEASRFHLAWWARAQAGRLLAERRGDSEQSIHEVEELARELEAAMAPPLDAARTLGSLGVMVASRVARELRLGGPSFTVSAAEASGLRALELAVRMLQRGEADSMIALAVDLAADERSAGAQARIRTRSPSPVARPFDGRADGSVPGDVAVALRLRRLADAERAGERILAVIRGLGAASGAGPAAPDRATWSLALRRAWEEAGAEPSSCGLLMAHGCGDPAADREEAAALLDFLGPAPEPRTALASLAPVAGDGGAAGSLASVAAAALALEQRLLPPLPDFGEPLPGLTWEGSALHVARAALPWLRDRRDGPRRAGVSAGAAGAGAAHVVLEEAPGRRTQWTGRPGEGGHGGPPLRSSRGSGPGSPEVAVVLPGSGNHYLGMGRSLLLAFPEVAEQLDADTGFLRAQSGAAAFAPYRVRWQPGWEDESQRAMAADPRRLVFAQVAHGIATTRVLEWLGLRPAAFLGYSLGESAAMFASGAWRDRDRMFAQFLASPLFATQLAGPCEVARRAWGVERADWLAAVLPRDAAAVRAALRGTASLLIVNAPGECVVGGRAGDVRATARALGCEAFPLPGVATVHCALVDEVAPAYRELHLQPTGALPDGVRLYSAAWARAYEPESGRVADSLLESARRGFDFPALVERAWADGVRVFVEAGPQGSCTRMIDRILKGRPHLAVSACVRGMSARGAVLRAAERLLEAGVSLDRERLRRVAEEEDGARADVRPAEGGAGTAAAARRATAAAAGAAEPIVVPCHRPNADLGDVIDRFLARRARPAADPFPPLGPPARAVYPAPRGRAGEGDLQAALGAAGDAAHALLQAGAGTAAAHARWLAFQAEGVAIQRDLCSNLLSFASGSTPIASDFSIPPLLPLPTPDPPLAPSVQALPEPIAPAFDRAACLEFARGSIAAVLGPTFAEADRYPTRVRLPDEPLMLVDRIVSVEGSIGGLGSGRVVTEHDVLPAAWYLDGGHAPVCISVEAGQADLFLSAWLGIDLRTRGERVYRLLDAEVSFHRDLPRPGETCRYDIRIDRFIRQGSTWMFFFQFDGSVDGRPFITMRNGCAGFWSREQLSSGRGLVDADMEPEPDAIRRRGGDGAAAAQWDGDPGADAGRVPGAQAALHSAQQSLDDTAVEALRRGDLEAAFGPTFAGRRLARSLCLPDGRMRLVHRVPLLDPHGGRWGLGAVEAEADVAPDDWYLTCHFVDDRVMPGTLMYEASLQAMRVLLLRKGFGATEAEAEAALARGTPLHWAPILDLPSKLRCRGQVTEETRKVRYRLDLREIGRDPEPYAIAHAILYADERRIVRMGQATLRLAGAGRRPQPRTRARTEPELPPPLQPPATKPAFDAAAVDAYCDGRPSLCFGPSFAVFDEGPRRCARLPREPYKFLDRVTELSGTPGELRPGTTLVSEWDVDPRSWFFDAAGSPVVPHAVLLEAALQPCGFLAAFSGAPLRGEDLYFRNLEGVGTVHSEIRPDSGTLRCSVRALASSAAGGMILQQFAFDLRDGRGGKVYEATTRFGFFPREALAEQQGIRGAAERAWRLPMPDGGGGGGRLPLARGTGLRWSQLDRIEQLDVAGGPHGLGAAVASRRVDPEDWFFRAHFRDDPVMPGSLGVEAFLQLLEELARARWPELADSHRVEAPALGAPHRWTYRGQVLRTAGEIRVEAVVTRVAGDDGPAPLLAGSGFLHVDGLPIYELIDYAIRLVPRDSPGHAP